MPAIVTTANCMGTTNVSQHITPVIVVLNKFALSKAAAYSEIGHA